MDTGELVDGDSAVADWFARRRPDAHARRLAQQIEALGFRVTIEPTEQAA